MSNETGRQARETATKYEQALKYLDSAKELYSGPQKLDSSLSCTLPRGSRTDE